MKNKSLVLFLLLTISMPCFAGGIKGGFIDDGTIMAGVAFLILIHVFSILAYAFKTWWLRIICGVLYLPVFIIPLILTFFYGGFIVLFLPTIAFYFFIVINKRK